MEQLLASHRVGRLLGIEVHVSYLLYLLTGFLLLDQLIVVRHPAHLLFLLGPLLVPVFVLLHELGHSLAAMKERVGVRKIVLYPIGGLAHLDGALPGPGAEIFVALSGPFVSLLLAAIATIPALLFGGLELFLSAGAGGGVLAGLLYYLFGINLALALFNLLPFFPMDGGRVATAVAVMRLGPQRGVAVMHKVARVGAVVLMVLGLLRALSGNLFGGIILAIIGIFVWRSSSRQTMLAQAYAAQYTDHGGPGYYAGDSWKPAFSQLSREADEPWREAPGEPERQPGWWERWQTERKRKAEAKAKEEQDALAREVDRILAKVKESGIGSLTPEERDCLNRASRSYR